MHRLDLRGTLPSGMEEYLSLYGWHFSKKMCEWAVSHMKKDVSGKLTKIQPYTKDTLQELLSRYNITLENDFGYDSVYVANMCKADFLNNSVPDEQHLVKFIKNYIDDPDGYEGLTFTRFYADCIGSGTPIIWEDLI